MSKTPKTYVIELTAAVVMDGEVLPAGELVEVTEKEAKNLLHRGKAVLAPEKAVADAGIALQDMTVENLRKLADDAGIEGYRGMKKEQLIDALDTAE